MKHILLTQGKVALVSDEDYDFLLCFNWQAQAINAKLCYAKRFCNNTVRYMHHEVADRAGLVIPYDFVVDHIDRDGLNCQRNNLRVVTESMNASNRKQTALNTSGCRGVSFNVRKNLWAARIWYRKSDMHLGYFTNFDDAVKARKAAEVKLLGSEIS